MGACLLTYVMQVLKDQFGPAHSLVPELNTRYHHSASQITKASYLTQNLSQSSTYMDGPGVRGNWWLGGSRLPETFALCEQVSVEADHQPAA